jgi:leader peptidase (prepilin peptidase)/N-methyltransferase
MAGTGYGIGAHLPIHAPVSTASLPAPVVSRVRSPAVIAGAILLAAAAAAAQSSVTATVLCGVLVLVLVPCAVIDIERRIIPNRITYPAALVAVALGLALDAGHEPQRLLWAAIAGGFLLLTAFINPAGMGMGDVKLLAVMGLFLGRPVLVALLLALLGPVFVGVIVARRQGLKAARKSTLPFGPYLALGGLVAALVGNPIIHAYLNLRH